MYKSHLPEVEGKQLVSRNFGSIKHLNGSKMVDFKDTYLGESQQKALTQQRMRHDDLVIIREKIDGQNVGVIKKNGKLYPINRKGYDVRTMGKSVKELRYLSYVWAKWVNDNYHILSAVLSEGERLVFENAILKHTIGYKFKNEAVFLLAKYDSVGVQVVNAELEEIAAECYCEMPQKVNEGLAIPVSQVIESFTLSKTLRPNGIAGVVYRYEHGNEFSFYGKYVSNPLLCEMQQGHYPTYLNKFNGAESYKYDPNIALILGCEVM